LARITSMIFDLHGNRKYLTPAERERFINACYALPEEQQAFCLALAFSGCRISEALACTPSRVDRDMQALVIRSLKKRVDEPVYRAVPLPSWLLDRFSRLSEGLDPAQRLWPWGRTHGWKIIKRVMSAARISGMHATPKGLRHGFGVAAVQSGVPLNLVQRWLGHAKLETTAIYTNAIGDEERAIAARLWGDLQPKQAA
jgi:integrase/recombinase XerD